MDALFEFLGAVVVILGTTIIIGAAGGILLMFAFDILHGYYPAVAPFSFGESFVFALTIAFFTTRKST